MHHPDSSLINLISDLETRLQSHSDTPRLDAQVLLAHILGKTRTWLLAHPEETLTHRQNDSMAEALSRLESSVPLPYVLGHWEFYGLDFLINHHVLIPRPETELLVEHAIQWLCANPNRRNAADIATGSGCIAVSLAVKIPNLRLLATDINLPALSVAEQNALKHNVADRIEFRQADLLDFSPPAPFDLICANLPYIPSATLSKLEVYRQEPLIALDGGPNGLDLVRRMLSQARDCIIPGGLMLLEIEANQGAMAQSLATQMYENARISVHPDLAGHDRLLEIQL